MAAKKRTGGGVLSAAAILQADDLNTKKVPVPEWGGCVYIRTMTAGEKDEFDLAMLDADGKVKRKDIRARLVVTTAVDADGARLFAETDAPALSKKNGAAVDRLFAVAQALNGFTDADIEELLKN